MTGRQPEQKYEGSYRMLARAIGVFVAPDHQAAAFEQLFDTVALSCMVGNGDAHLKNFGVLYTHPAAGDIRLAPVYDIVNTTMYLPEDSLALKLDAGKSFATSRAGLRDLATACGIDEAHAEARIRRLVVAVERVLGEQRALFDDAPALRRAIENALDRFAEAG